MSGVSSSSQRRASKRSAATMGAANTKDFLDEGEETPMKVPKNNVGSASITTSIAWASPGAATTGEAGSQRMRQSLEILSKQSSEIKEMVERVGYPSYSNLREGDFMDMARSLISQQISVQGAVTITAKVEDYLFRDIVAPSKEEAKLKANASKKKSSSASVILETGVEKVVEYDEKEREYGVFSSRNVMALSDKEIAEKILKTEDEVFKLISIGNGPKMAALKDLADHVNKGKLDIPNLKNLNNEEVINQISAVRGFGVWSAQMHMIFALGREDVWPASDLALQKGLSLIFPKERKTFDGLKSTSDKTKWAKAKAKEFPAEHHSALARLCYSTFNALNPKKKN